MRETSQSVEWAWTITTTEHLINSCCIKETQSFFYVGVQIIILKQSKKKKDMKVAATWKQVEMCE